MATPAARMIEDLLHAEEQRTSAALSSASTAAIEKTAAAIHKLLEEERSRDAAASTGHGSPTAGGDPPLKVARPEGADSEAAQSVESARSLRRRLTEQVLTVVRWGRHQPLGLRTPLPGTTCELTEPLCCALVCAFALTTREVSSAPLRRVPLMTEPVVTKVGKLHGLEPDWADEKDWGEQATETRGGPKLRAWWRWATHLLNVSRGVSRALHPPSLATDMPLPNVEVRDSDDDHEEEAAETAAGAAVVAPPVVVPQNAASTAIAPPPSTATRGTAESHVPLPPVAIPTGGIPTAGSNHALASAIANSGAPVPKPFVVSRFDIKRFARVLVGVMAEAARRRGEPRFTEAKTLLTEPEYVRVRDAAGLDASADDVIALCLEAWFTGASASELLVKYLGHDILDKAAKTPHRGLPAILFVFSAADLAMQLVAPLRWPLLSRIKLHVAFPPPYALVSDAYPGTAPSWNVGTYCATPVPFCHDEYLLVTDVRGRPVDVIVFDRHGDWRQKVSAQIERGQGDYMFASDDLRGQHGRFVTASTDRSAEALAQAAIVGRILEPLTRMREYVTRVRMPDIGLNRDPVKTGHSLAAIVFAIAVGKLGHTAS